MIEAFYPELKRLAAARIGHLPNRSWQPTVLVNEFYLELLKVKGLRPVRPGDASEKNAFFALAAQVMRWLLVRHARALRRKVHHTELHTALPENAPGLDSLAEIDTLLGRLEAIDPQLRLILELRAFEGLSIEEIAARLDLSVRTVTRRWQFVKLWLQQQIFPDELPVNHAR